MNRFTFPAKFFLVSMLFAVPLSITSIQSTIDSNQQLRATHLKYIGAKNISDFLPVIVALETLRDLSVVKRFHSSPITEEKYDSAKNDVLAKLNYFIEHKLSNASQLISMELFALKRSIQVLSLSSGSEADLESAIFDKVNLIVDSAYSIQYQIANMNGLLGDIDPLANHLVVILTAELQKSFEAMGEVRAYGSYFITNKVLSSSGVELINNGQAKLKDGEGHLRDRLTGLLSSYPKINNSHIIDTTAVNHLDEIYLQIDDQILLDPDLTTPIDVFWLQSSDSINGFNQFRRGLISFLEDHYVTEEEEMQVKRSTYAFAIGGLVCVFLYLFIGFYLGVKGSLKQLSKAAVQVANGALDKPIMIKSHDELSHLAALFEAMRIQLKERQQELIETTITDALTGIRNRKYFNDSLKERFNLSRKADQTTSLLMMDIDHFKRVNDTYGHTAGDKCLQLVAQCLQDSLGRPGDVVARYGGEEFAILLPDTDEKGATIIADKICNNIRKLPIDIEGEIITITISIGISTSSLIPDCKEERLVNLADEALYKAKETGRDKWVSAHA
ncbi:sensor domain-containing diguanylate cyclase [Alkalimarinus alittae]|uniref:diguanylate cyclase n=1 Tax=Alkalimarinus alittae TaxID=2961619 RepID=A0ABY6MYM6_9ALTE|nr:diguanylate cyclase [Alkalimarinus alittae]UZE94929.1 diguanylate cyclase [Alkalimarinus alittae]